ncbi:hypothetical protein H4R20_005460 [Coemansia guatemalensis]|uniref:Protein kinase domain-containing protein n=1 Tax=Coemansia guatemalensis TaxID=2761395 RepID=A0A9W8HWP1_9FUNG|nr:hypothetical protein H4R20_005460 [Coemansia guatemalensis]
MYRGEAAILKLSWTPTNRLPESAVYDALQRANVENTPEVFDMGILDVDAFGYRIEYLIIWNCGVSLVDYLKPQKHDQSALCDSIELLTRQVVKCLLQVWRAGIMHRDISSGNVVVRDGKATVIDWGYAKLIDCDSCDVDRLAAKWMFEKVKVMVNEDAHNSITGTPLFMSIPILVRAAKRSVVDDVESAFYVVLGALSAIQNAPRGFKPVAMDFKDNRNLAFVRIRCFSNAHMYLETFGVREYTGKLRELLDALYRYLFVRGGKYIGAYLAMVPDYDRSVEEQELSGILSGVKQSEKKPTASGSRTVRAAAPLRRSARLIQSSRGGDSQASTHSGGSDIPVSAIPLPTSKRKRTK